MDHHDVKSSFNAKRQSLLNNSWRYLSRL
jgi:hypothetical protein